MALLQFGLFFVHPYLGLMAVAFTLFHALASLLVRWFNKNLPYKTILFQFASGLVAIVFFRVFMVITDHHVGRADQPADTNEYLSSLDSILNPYTFIPVTGALTPGIPGHGKASAILGLTPSLEFFACSHTWSVLDRKNRSSDLSRKALFRHFLRHYCCSFSHSAGIWRSLF